MSRILHSIDLFSALVAKLAMLLILVLICSMFYEVISRYAFNAPTIWSLDATYMLNGSIFVMGAGYTMSINQHVRIDFLSQALPKRFQHAANLTALAFFFLPAMIWITWRSTRGAWDAFLSGEVEVVSPWAPLVWPFEAAISLGLICFCLQIIAQIIRHAIGCYNPNATD